MSKINMISYFKEINLKEGKKRQKRNTEKTDPVHKQDSSNLNGTAHYHCTKSRDLVRISH